jgi:hypothetical protein
MWHEQPGRLSIRELQSSTDNGHRHEEGSLALCGRPLHRFTRPVCPKLFDMLIATPGS